MNVVQTPTFSRQVKKLHKNQKLELDAAIKNLMQDPLLGDIKKGDLSGIRVYKFAMVNQLTLLAYQWQQQELELIILLALGSHENFYRDLKK